MPKPLSYVLAFLAISGVLGGAAYFIYEAGADSVRLEYETALTAALEEQARQLAAQQAAVTIIETAGRDAIAEHAAVADALAEEIAHADLSPQRTAGDDDANRDVVCADSFGAEYYRLLREVRGDEAAATGAAGPLPRGD